MSTHTRREGQLMNPRPRSPRKRRSEPKTRVQRTDAPGSSELAMALADCRAAARRGYAIAKEHLESSRGAITSMARNVRHCLSSTTAGIVNTPDVARELESQLTTVADELHQLQHVISADLEQRRQRLDTFTISLFGRTMAGKSTLMEILTDGTGASIGSGAQRTTRDVRCYTPRDWDGLEVLDVPGVAAFEGADDERLALEAASRADLVLFLITDDAPQPAEAECLAEIRRLGKNVLGICNVKAALDDEDDLLLFLRDRDSLFDRRRLQELIDQFRAFANQHLPGHRVPFAVAHLRSRFLANQPAYRQHGQSLIKASGFAGIERDIVRKIVGSGRFLRVKSFVDGASTPLLALMDTLLRFSAKNAQSGRVLVGKRRQLQSWVQSFRQDGQRRIDALVERTVGELRSEVPSFAEDHYDDKRVTDRWRKLIDRAGIDPKARRLQESLANKCQRSLDELARELGAELDLVATLSADREIESTTVSNPKRWVNWATKGLSGGLAIAALVIGTGPLGWAVAAAVGLVGLIAARFLEDRETKARRARQKLQGQLHRHLDEIDKQLRTDLRSWLQRELIDARARVVEQDLAIVTNALFTLADAQRQLAWELNARQRDLARHLVAEALSQLGRPELGARIRDVARLPGLATMLLLAPKTAFPADVREDLAELLDEKAWFINDTLTKNTLIAKAIEHGFRPRDVRIEQRIQVAHVPLERLDAEGRERVRLAEQLTRLHIIR